MPPGQFAPNAAAPLRPGPTEARKTAEYGLPGANVEHRHAVRSTTETGRRRSRPATDRTRAEHRFARLPIRSMIAVAGGGRDQRMLAARLASFADRGLLDLPDPLEAAGHLGTLVTNALNLRPLIGAELVDEAEVDRIVTSGVRVFLRAYRPDPD